MRIELGGVKIGGFSGRIRDVVVEGSMKRKIVARVVC